MIIMFTADHYKVLYIYCIFFSLQPKNKKKNFLNILQHTVYDKKEMLKCIWKTTANKDKRTQQHEQPVINTKRGGQLRKVYSHQISCYHSKLN